MAEDDEAEEESAVELGEGADVEGAPLARVASRLRWPISKSDVVAQEGDATIRTPDGPRELEAVLANVDETYFDTRQSFTEAVEAQVGRGPIPTE